MRPIPSCYCVYLLRSKNPSHQKSFYIGSTPNPRRRLNQHNGQKNLGAGRTRRAQPWGMVGVVMGFPSQVAALQFEWAWQNAHLTRHLLEENRVAFRAPTKSKKKNRVKYTQLGKTSLPSTLKKLLLLLRSKSFGRLQLEVRFFTQDVFNIWEKTMAASNTQLRDSIKVALDCRRFESQHDPVQPSVTTDPEGNVVKMEPVGIDAIDVKYSTLKNHLRKSIALLDSAEVSCALCLDRMSPEKDLVLVCPGEDCSMTAHLSCLSNRFLDVEQDVDSILPLKGSCPACSSTLVWSELMRDVSMRSRGRAQAEKLTRARKSDATAPTTLQVGPRAPNLEHDEASAKAEAIISIALDESENEGQLDGHSVAELSPRLRPLRDSPSRQRKLTGRPRDESHSPPSSPKSVQSASDGWHDIEAFSV